jgi:hypothetical protein
MTQARIYNLLGNLLGAAQELIELEHEAGQIQIEQLAAILYEKNHLSTYSDTIKFLKSLIASYESYQEYIQEINDKYDVA